MRHIHPLWLREKLYFHSSARNHWPHQCDSMELELAPVRLHHFSKADSMHRQIAWVGFYELRLSKRIARLAATEGMLFDVGANIGYFSLLWAAAHPANRVFAFEPSPMVFEMLKGNVEEAGLGSNIQAHKVALSKETGVAEFDTGPNDQTGWGGISCAPSQNTIRVATAKLDDVMRRNGVIDILKIDTEGADAWVLEGARELLNSHRIRHIFFEQNLPRMNALGIPHTASFHTLESCGYKVEPLRQEKNNFYARPV